jgi:DNA-cytosine methyltransferase
MNILSLFDGIGCARVAFERAGIKIDEYYASEVDKWAIQIAQKNYPNTIQVGDIKSVRYDNKKLWFSIEYDPSYYTPTEIDLLIGGSPCFIAGTSVICKNKIKNIEDIIVGDEVLTHKGNYKKVLKIGNENKKIYSLIAQGSTPTHTTENHPYYICQREKKWNNDKRKYEWIYSKPEWIKIKDIKNKSYVGTPIIQEESNPLNLTEDECFILGLYIGDGHTRKDYRKSENRNNDRHWQLIISIGRHETELFKKQVKIKHSLYKHTKNVYRAVFSNKRLVQIAEEHCGIGAINKKISKLLLNLPKNLLKKIIEGYEFADGSNKDNIFKATTISKRLVENLSLATAKVYKTTCTISYTKRPNKTIIEGRIVNQKDTWSIGYRKKHTKQSRAFIIDNIVWNPIKRIIITNKTNIVYNIHVEEDHSYIANNHIVHNCQDLSIAKKNREGLKGNRSGLFWEYVRILNEVIPKYFILENVASMPKEAKQIITDTLGVEPVMINASLVSAQNRKRLFWVGKLCGDKYEKVNIKLPEDKGIILSDILEKKVDEKYYVNSDKFKITKKISKDKTKAIRVAQFNSGGQGDGMYSPEGKSVALSANGGSRGAKTGLYHVPHGYIKEKVIEVDKYPTLCSQDPRTKHLIIENPDKSYCIDANYYKGTSVENYLKKKRRQLVVDENHIRKLTPIECERLQGLKDGYADGISNTQRYKCLGNAFNVDVIVHILKFLNLTKS